MLNKFKNKLIATLPLALIGLQPLTVFAEDDDPIRNWQRPLSGITSLIEYVNPYITIAIILVATIIGLLVWYKMSTGLQRGDVGRFQQEGKNLGTLLLNVVVVFGFAGFGILLADAIIGDYYNVAVNESAADHGAGRHNEGDSRETAPPPAPDTGANRKSGQ